MITISQESFHHCLEAVTRVSLKSSLPAFSLVRLDAATNGTLILSCFNGETAARAITHAACDEELSVSVDAMTLDAVVKTLTGEIQLSVEQNSLILTSPSNRTMLRIVDEVLPIIGNENIRTLAMLSGSTFRSLARILSFASTDYARSALQVWHLTLEKDSIIAQTADGYSAGHVQETMQEGHSESISISLPLSFARLLATMIDDHDSVRFGTSGSNRYLFQITDPDASKELTLATVAPADNFPTGQIASLIEDARQQTVAHLRVQQTSLVQTIRMVSAMDTQSTFIKAVDGVVKMASAESNTGQARNILDGTATGENASVWLSSTFLRRAVEASKGELTIRIADEKKPVLIEAGSFTAVIMPMLVEGSKDPFLEDEAIAVALPEMATAS